MILYSYDTRIYDPPTRIIKVQRAAEKGAKEMFSSIFEEKLEVGGSGVMH